MLEQATADSACSGLRDRAYGAICMLLSYDQTSLPQWTLVWVWAWDESGRPDESHTGQDIFRVPAYFSMLTDGADWRVVRAENSEQRVLRLRHLLAGIN